MLFNVKDLLGICVLVLLGISESMPFKNIPSNGIIHWMMIMMFKKEIGGENSLL